MSLTVDGRAGYARKLGELNPSEVREKLFDGGMACDAKILLKASGYSNGEGNFEPT